MLLSCEIALFRPIRLRITSLLDNKTLCSYRNMSNNMSSVMATACLEPALQVLNFFKISSATLKVLMTIQKYLFKLILKSISKFSHGVVATSFFLEGGGAQKE